MNTNFEGIEKALNEANKLKEKELQMKEKELHLKEQQLELFQNLIDAIKWMRS